MNIQPPLPAGDIEQVLRETAEGWSGLRGARFFITGATGFFGRWILESLLAADRRWDLELQVVALSRDPGRFLSFAPHLVVHQNLEWLEGSVRTLNAPLLAGRKFDVVIHLATEGDQGAVRNDVVAAVDVITGGTRRVLDVAREAGATRFLFTSSGAAYGRQPADMSHLPETYAGRPDSSDGSNAYAAPGEAKRQAELLCQTAAQQDGLGAVIARGFTFAGPALPLEGKFAFGNFLRDALNRRPIVIEGDGTPVRSYLYAADLAAWLWIILMRGTPGRIYNVGSEQSVTLRALADMIGRELRSPGVEVKQPPGAGEVHRYVPSTRRARDELGLKETVDLGEIIRRTAEWHRSMVKH